MPVTQHSGGGFTVSSSYRDPKSQLAQSAALLDAFGQQRRQREEQEKRRAYEKAVMAMEGVSKGGIDPGADVVRQSIEALRKHDPQSAELFLAQLDVAKQQREREAASESAMSRWMQGVEAQEAPLREIVANPQAWHAPLLTPETAAAKIPQVPGEVAGQMPFAERETVRRLAKDRGFEFPAAPTPIDMWGTTFPADTRAHVAAEVGILPPEVAEAERIDRGLKLSAGQVESSRIADESGVRADERLKLDQAGQQLARERLRLDQQEAARRAREAAAGGGAAPANTKDVTKWMSDETALRVRERNFAITMVPQDERGDIAAQIEEIPALSQLQSTRIVNAIVADLKANGLPVTDAMVQESASRAVDEYYRLMREIAAEDASRQKRDKAAGRPTQNSSAEASRRRDEAVRRLLGGE